MITVTFLDETYECTTALKGSDYIHLLDSDGGMVASFDGVTDFSDFEISNGEWTTPMSENDCHVAVIREDGTIAKGGHTCKELWEGRIGEKMELKISGTSAAFTAEPDSLYVIVADENTYILYVGDLYEYSYSTSCGGRIFTAANYCYYHQGKSSNTGTLYFNEEISSKTIMIRKII